MSNYFIVLNRTLYTNDGICGCLYLYDCDKNSIVYRTNTLEHSTKYIPKGDYSVVVNHSSKFNEDLPLIENVPNRDGIRIHAGNYQKDTSGCILVGERYYTTPTLFESRKTLSLLLSYLEYAEQIRILII